MLFFKQKKEKKELIIYHFGWDYKLYSVSSLVEKFHRTSTEGERLKSTTKSNNTKTTQREKKTATENKRKKTVRSSQRCK